MPAITGIAHVELSVRDLDASTAWYGDVIGMKPVWDGADAAQGIVARALRDPGSGIVLALTQHTARSGDRFDARGPGLDHLSFAVADRNQLRAWERHLAGLGVDYTPFEEWSHGAAVTARDPDGIAVEFYVRGAAQ
jgi:glyoxylase I family protein